MYLELELRRPAEPCACPAPRPSAVVFVLPPPPTRQADGSDGSGVSMLSSPVSALSRTGSSAELLSFTFSPSRVGVGAAASAGAPSRGPVPPSPSRDFAHCATVFCEERVEAMAAASTGAVMVTAAVDPSTGLGTLRLYNRQRGQAGVSFEPGLHPVTDGSGTPLQFQLGSGQEKIAFMDGSDTQVLVAETSANKVHVVDVQPLGVLRHSLVVKSPRGVASSRSHVVVSSWRHREHGAHGVHVFKFDGAAWVVVAVLGGRSGTSDHLRTPCGLRVVALGTSGSLCVAVAELYNHRISVFDLGSFSLKGHVLTGDAGPMDMELLSNDEGWLVGSDETRGLVRVPLRGLGPGRALTPFRAVHTEGEEGQLGKVPSLALHRDLLLALDRNRNRVMVYRVCPP